MKKIRSFVRAVRRNVHRADAWYVGVLCAVPFSVRPFYIESCRVERDCTSFVKFTAK